MYFRKQDKTLNYALKVVAPGWLRLCLLATLTLSKNIWILEEIFVNEAFHIVEYAVLIKIYHLILEA